jgi:predicted transcriptional regulator
MTTTNERLITRTADLAAAYVTHNHVSASELPTLLITLHGALCGLKTGPTPDLRPEPVAVDKPTPAQIRRSINQDHLVSFLDGRTYKTLKRHLRTHGLTPERYRERYGLPADYPMVAPSYGAQRSALAKAIGLGVPGAMAARQVAE